ncbi:uncharacterized protein LOC122648066 [Telopea speciosissima]|uniref:uncharacterized protein LOC122648066 n=1 Tax=Telopea speciosissima TaxID=54955 RepID=UPI001CC4E5F2|nr:uncharacterized protein LOC122648066 [Telopea speciosissima]
MELGKEVNGDEVKRVVFSLKSSKAPGPDGFGAGFYKHSWEVIGEELTHAVQWFFVNSFMPRSINATFITLVLKLGDVSTFAGFRPIALRNLLYKIITKILSNRIQHVIGSVVSHNQSAFIKGRSIVDNILVCHDIVRGIKQKAASPTAVLKVDLHKAYDSLSRKFLFDVMGRMGFLDKFIGWVKACVTTPMFSILINGSPTGFFNGGRGIRQGDPLSPYLFTLAMEAFSRIMRRLEIDGQIKLLPRCKSFHLSHLIFVDDLMIFVKGNRDSILASLGGLDEFIALSGLQLNRSKSSIILGGLTQTSSLELLDLMGFSKTKLPIRYLGVPLGFGRLSMKDCSPILDLFCRKLEGWKARFLSYAGHLQLLASVLQGSYIYWAGIFGLPGHVITKLESIFGSRICYDAGSYSLAARHACVKEIVRDGDWNPGPSTSFDLIDIWRALPTIEKFHDEVPDLTVWTGNSLGNFTSKSAWNAIRTRTTSTDWSEAFWFERGINSHCFIAWRCLSDALPTRDNLIHRHILAPHHCEFCWAGTESRNHLFFGCPFSTDIWKIIYKLCFHDGTMPSNVIDAAISVRYAAGRAGKLGLVTKLAFCATIKHIWSERNFRIFRNKIRPKDQIIGAIKGDVIGRLSSISLEGDPTTANLHIAAKWGLQVHWAARIPKACSWFAPNPNMVALHCDGSLANDKASFGGLIRDGCGDPIAAYAGLGEDLSVLSMELKAIYKGISLCIEKGLYDVSVRSDSKLAVDILNG